VQLLQADDVGLGLAHVLQLLLQAQRALRGAEVRDPAAHEGRREGRADEHVEGHGAEGARGGALRRAHRSRRCVMILLK